MSNYIQSQFDRLRQTKYAYTIKIWDSNGNSTNHLNLTQEELLQIQAILNKSKHNL